MQTYNAIVRLGGKLENEVQKNALTAPEVLILQKIHGKDSVIKIEPVGEWENHFGVQKVKTVSPNGQTVETEESFEYDDALERDRLMRMYSGALVQSEEQPEDAMARLFGEFAPLPTELAEFKAQHKADRAMKNIPPVSTSKKDNLAKVS